MARYGIVPRSEPINAVIFQGTPSQLINLPAFIKGAVSILAIGIGFGYASTQWPVPWFIPVLAVLLVLGGIGLAYLQVKFTEFEIDAERITCRKGILTRPVQSVELFRIQDVTGSSLVATHVRNRRSGRDDERFEQPRVAIAGDEGRGTIAQ